MMQAIQIIGSLMVLAGFAALQRGMISEESTIYLVLNFVGAGILAILAAIDRQYGFLILQGCWSIVSAVSLAKVLFSTKTTAKEN